MSAYTPADIYCPLHHPSSSSTLFNRPASFPSLPIAGSRSRRESASLEAPRYTQLSFHSFQEKGERRARTERKGGEGVGQLFGGEGTRFLDRCHPIGSKRTWRRRLHTSTGSFPLEQILAPRSAFLLPRSKCLSRLTSPLPNRCSFIRTCPTIVLRSEYVSGGFFSPSPPRGTRFKLFSGVRFFEWNLKLIFPF